MRDKSQRECGEGQYRGFFDGKVDACEGGEGTFGGENVDLKDEADEES